MADIIVTPNWDDARVRELAVGGGTLDISVGLALRSESDFASARRVAGQHYDAWLTAHDAEVKAEAWSEGYSAGRDDEYGYPAAGQHLNPYRQEANHG